MTRPPEDTPPLWLKLQPNQGAHPEDCAFWTRRLHANHSRVGAAAEPPHGEAAECACGFPGRFDSDDSPDRMAVFADSIWVNGPGGDPECVDCYLK